MSKGGRTYLLLIFALITSLFLACERIEPVGVDGEGDELGTMINPGVIWLDTTDYKYLGLLDQKHIFEFSGTQDLPSPGDLVYFYNSDNQVFGKVETASSEGQILWLSLSVVPLNDIFSFMALKNDLSENGVDTLYLNGLANQVADTLYFKPIELLWDIGVGQYGLFKIDSLVIYNDPEGTQNFYMGPVWNSGVGTRRLDLNFTQQYHFAADVNIVAEGNFQVQDSLKVRTRLIGPYFADSFPVYYLVEEWLKIEFNCSGDNRLNTGFRLDGRSSAGVSYRQDGAWEITQDFSQGSEKSDSVKWDKLNSCQLSLNLNTKLTQVFCGIHSIMMSWNNKWQVSANLDWPVWDYLVSNNIDFKLTPDNRIFSDISAQSPVIPGLSRNLFSENGELANTAPVADFTVNPTSGFTDTNFSFSAANSSDFEDDPSQLQVRWDFNGDEIWDTNYSFGKEVFHIFPTPGNYTVVMEVKDSQDLTASLAKNVHVQAASSAPTPYFTVNPENGRISDRFTFDASGSWDTEDDVSQLKVRWDFEGDDIWDTQFSTVKTAFHFYPEPGVYHPKVDVKDTQGLSSSTSTIIEVKAANIKPLAFFTVTPVDGTISTNFLFDASGSSDPEDDISLLMVRWDFENDGIWDTEYRTIKTINHIFPIAGNYTVVMEVKDSDGFSNSFFREVRVSNPNTKPKADFTISPAVGDTTTEFTFDASISTDLEDSLEDLQFRWDWNNDDIYDTQYSSSPVLLRTYPEPGSYIVKLQVIDSGGLTHTKAHLVIVN